MEFARLIDTSHWNGAVPDLAKAKAQGVVGGIHRLGSIDNLTGVCYTDYRLVEYVAAYKAADLPIGYYWYSRPKWGGGRQVDYILTVLKEFNLPMDLDFWIDVEEPGNDPEQARDAVKYMAQELLKIYPGRVGIYSRQNLWDQMVVQDPFWPALKLWAARWNTSITSPWSDGKTVFRDWSIWTMWQYSADGNNLGATYGFTGDADIDLDYFNGNVEAFKKAYNLVPSDQIAELTVKIAALEEIQKALLQRMDSLETASMVLEKGLSAETELGRLRTDRIKVIEDAINNFKVQ